MDIMFLDDAWQDYLYWRREASTLVQKIDKKILKRINQLIKEIQRTPFEGVGKPEPLKFDMSGLWSRRINQEHRLIYQVKEEYIVIVQCRYHY